VTVRNNRKPSIGLLGNVSTSATPGTTSSSLPLLQSPFQTEVVGLSLRSP